ncbi:hypothetical protein ENBRE01_1846 [Enteropsectra breve]|nr:hypothetical protein ENBRE01_1846 [Enteropsectra breve]
MFTPPESPIKSEISIIFIYLKRLYKLKTSANKSNQDKEYLHFCDSLCKNLTESLWYLSVVQRLTVIKVCFFYNRKYSYIMHQSSFLNEVFDGIDKILANSEEHVKFGFTELEFNEMIALRALNYDKAIRLKEKASIKDYSTTDSKECLLARCASYYSLNENAQKYLALNLMTRGRLLSTEGLEKIPQLCKNYCIEDEYRLFLKDVCFAKHLPNCIIESEILNDLASESINYSKNETGMLPLLSDFYIRLNCEAWQENEVLEWCMGVDFLSLIDNLDKNNSKKCGIPFIKKHFRSILRYIIDSARDDESIEEQAEKIVKCWQAASYGQNNCVVSIFEALAASKNGYFHANIFYLMNRKTHGEQIVETLLDKIANRNYTDNESINTDESNDLELQKAFVEYVKTWEEHDVSLFCSSTILDKKIKILVGGLKKIKIDKLEDLFKAFLKHCTSLNAIKKNHSNFYKEMTKSLDYIPQAALDAYGH